MRSALRSTPDPRPLVVHIMYRFAVGGLENGVANLVNRMAPDTFRHAIVALTTVTELRDRITRDDVQFHACLMEGTQRSRVIGTGGTDTGQDERCTTFR